MSNTKTFNSVVAEDLLDNLFMGLTISYFLEGKQPTLYKIGVIISVTLFYWLVVYNTFKAFTRGI